MTNFFTVTPVSDEVIETLTGLELPGVMVMDPDAAWPASIDEGWMLIVTTLQVNSFRLAERVTDPKVALTETLVAAVGADVKIEKVNDVSPAGTMIAVGTWTSLDVDVKATDIPPEGAGPVSVTVALVESPTETVDGENPKL